MAKSLKILVFIGVLLVLTEGKLDIKCNNGTKQEVDISSHDFGNMYSPGYTEGKPYPNFMYCEIHLEAQEGRHIRLTFNDIDVLRSSVCNDGFLGVYDLHNDKAFQWTVGKYCGNVTVPDYVSVSNTVIISFGTSFIGAGRGFNVTYRQVSTGALCQPGELQCRNRKCVLESVRCNGSDECGDGTDEEDCDYPVPPPSKCGVPEVEPFTGNAIVDRIVGGREAIRGSWPWQVDMQLDSALANGHFCGGSLISPQWFITAAHCMQQVRQQPFVTRVHLGNHHKYKKDPYEQIRYIKDYFIHGVDREDFEITGEYNLRHDIALVKLNAPVLMNPHVQVVCLPQSNEELKTGEKCFSTGWGMTRGSGNEDVLKQAEHPVQNATLCNNVFMEFVKETMICVGSLKPLNGVCHGDSGGPLVCKKGGKWHLYGATSFLTDTNFVNGLCGLANAPSSFSKISVVIDWIDDVIANNSEL